MSDLGDIPRELWNLVKSVFREIGHMMIVPWHFRVYRESVGAPPIPAHLLQRMNALAEQEASAEVLADALDIIDGLIESARLSDPVPGERGRSRCARPRRCPTHVPANVAMIDDRIAAQVPEAYLADSIATVLAGGWDVLFRDHEDSKPLRVAFAAYAGALLLDVAAQKLGFEILETENWSASVSRSAHAGRGRPRQSPNRCSARSKRSDHGRTRRARHAGRRPHRRRRTAWAVARG